MYTITSSVWHCSPEKQLVTMLIFKCPRQIGNLPFKDFWPNETLWVVVSQNHMTQDN